VPGLSSGTVMVAVMSPFRAALGAGLGRADAEPMVRAVTVPRELKPDPVTTTISSTAACAGVIVIEGLGTEKPVVLPVIVPIVAVTILVPGLNDPPVVAAGTSVTTEKAPVPSVMNPPEGTPLEEPKVRVDPVVFGGNPVPETVTALPVEAEAGVTDTVPAGTVRLAVVDRSAVASVATVPVFRLLALSVTVIVLVPAVSLTGIVTVPVPEPSEPMGKATVPVKATPLELTVNSAL